MDKYSFLGSSELSAIENIFQQYKDNPNNVDESWQAFFKGFDFALQNYETKLNKPQFAETASNEKLENEFKVINLIEGYRLRGHLFTKTNPVRKRRQYFPTLDYQNFGLKTSDLEQVFHAGKNIGLGAVTLKEIINHLELTYCQSIGVEYIYLREPEILQWLQSKMEAAKNTPVFSAEQKKDIFHNLKQAVGFEQFIHKKFVGQKRFSLEGAEALIPALDAVIEFGAELGIKEFIIGMPHRGRLNVLANIMQKPYEQIFNEFTGQSYDESVLLGDVKYHLGFDKEITTDKGKNVKLLLVPNPSHLETVAPIVEGLSRSRIENEYQNNFKNLAPIIIHGDAAIAAQGVVYEVVQMMSLKGYKTGGSIHLVVNNQVGFTTDYLDARSSTYCTDIAKVTRSPVFHVNGDDVEALVFTIQLAMEYRQRFHRDVFIDILCYRKYGHNEGDEPRFTQPELYKIIEKHPNPRDIYAQKLLSENIFSAQYLQDAMNEFDGILELKLEAAKKIGKVHIYRFLKQLWKNYKFADNDDFKQSPNTAVSKDILLELVKRITFLPQDKVFFKKIEKLMNDRQKMLETNRLDWAMGELLAYASLLYEQHPVRISGQDCERGTFSHRHAVVVVDESKEKYYPLRNVSDNQAQFSIFNSHLSEYGVLGFEYGYALAVPEGLTVWEAQFGDFHNVAQPIIDQYISSAEEKWGLMNGLVMLLPHGYEGQGPEHSSARVERFLNLAVNNNIQVLNCSTPANFFHALRRQVKRNFRIPLIVFTPKSLLRHQQCTSPLEDFYNNNFQEVIDDNNVVVADVKRVVYCTGKIYYDLLERKNQLEATDVAIVRIEQLHPFPLRNLVKTVRKYHNAKLSLWVQEEPINMGAWNYIKNSFKGVNLEVIARDASASPAAGLHHYHTLRQNKILNKVFRKCDCTLQNKYCGLQCVEGRSAHEIVTHFRYLFEED